MNYWNAPYPYRGVIRETAATPGGVFLPRETREPKIVVAATMPTEPPPAPPSPPKPEPAPEVEYPELERYDWIKALAERCNLMPLPIPVVIVEPRCSGQSVVQPDIPFKVMVVYFEPKSDVYIREMRVGNRSQMAGWGDPGIPLQVFLHGPLVLQFDTANVGNIIRFDHINQSDAAVEVVGFCLGTTPEQPLTYYTP